MVERRIRGEGESRHHYSLMRGKREGGIPVMWSNLEREMGGGTDSGHYWQTKGGRGGGISCTNKNAPCLAPMRTHP